MKTEPLIVFKSWPENWEKECSGRKSNTVRKFELNDHRFQAVEGQRIKIVNTQTRQAFTRTLSDVTHWEGWTIFSWRHQ